MQGARGWGCAHVREGPSKVVQVGRAGNAHAGLQDRRVKRGGVEESEHEGFLPGRGVRVGEAGDA